MKSFGDMVKQAQKVQKQMNELQDKLKDETFEANVHHVYLQLLPLFRSQDFQEGVKSFIERRPPKFTGR